MSRLITPLLASVLVSGCGASGPVAQTSTGVVADAPAAVQETSTKAVVAKRDAPVPEPIDPEHERVIFLKAGAVWVMNHDGEEAAQLTVRSHDGPDDDPAFSPRGELIAYSSPIDGTRKILLISLEELLPKVVTEGLEGGGGDSEPSWSPDGRKIAFTRGDSRERRDIYIADLAAGAPPQLLLEGNDDHPEQAGAPAWSPDGKKIVFASDRRQGRGTTLWLVDVASKRLQPLTRTRPEAQFIRDHDPSWSPDGNRVVFASNRHANSSDDADQFDIYAINSDGSGLTRLTDDPATATDPVYSPDGNRIYFVSNREQQNPYEMELYVMAAVGGKQQRVTRDERPQNRAPSTGIAK